MAHGVIVNSAKRHLHSRLPATPHWVILRSARATNLANFGTGSQGYGGGPSFTGGTYGNADERSDSPYFQEVGFNRGYYEDPFGRESFPQDAYRRESYPRQSYPYARAMGTPGFPPQRRRYPMGPKGYQRSDERLREEISERLMEAYHIDSSDVTVQVLGARVVLEGTVPDRHMKHAIEDLADAAPGVQDVDNRIRVVLFRERVGGGITRTPASHEVRGTRRNRWEAGPQARTRDLWGAPEAGPWEVGARAPRGVQAPAPGQRNETLSAGRRASEAGKRITETEGGRG